MSLYDRQFYASQEDDSIRSARHVLPIVLDLVKPRSVIDVGCGTGGWLAICINLGVSDVLGIDGYGVPSEILRIPEAQFISADLRKPFAVDREFDLVMSLEVAEHLPRVCERDFVESLSKLGPAILFAAGAPTRSGVGHVNEQWPSHWAALFSEQGYQAIDCVRPRVWDNQEVAWWYAQDTLLYVHEELIEQSPRLKASGSHVHRLPLDIIHPRLFEEVIDPKRMSFRKACAAVLLRGGLEVGQLLRRVFGESRR